MSTYNVFFPALADVTPTILNGTDLYRVAFKSAAQFNSLFTGEIVFKYTATTFNNGNGFANEYYMTLLHRGDTAAGNGLSLVIKNNNGTYQLGLLVNSGSGWGELTTFQTIDTTKAYMVLISYDYSASIATIEFRFTEYKPNPSASSTITIEYAFITISGPTINFNGLNQTGIGSIPQSIVYDSTTNPYGLLTDSGYNGYVAQDVYFTYSRLWSRAIPTNATSIDFGFVNSTPTPINNNTFSLYYVNHSNSNVPASTSNLEFQLGIPTNTLAELTNTATNPATAVTITITGNPNFQTLPDFSVNGLTGTVIVPTEINCILKGTKILTIDGYKLIEDITVGDVVVTHKGKHTKVVRTNISYAMPNEKSQCIIIPTGVYGANADLYISKNHSVLVGNIFIKPIKRIPETIIYATGIGIYEYYDIMTEDYLRDTLVANGVPIETWGGQLATMKTFKYPLRIPRDENKNRILL
jgi:hypothetical protein